MKIAKGYGQMKKILIILAIALMLCILGTAAAEDYPFLGKPFVDFSFTDTDGNEFSLSEALKDHEAVVINLWTSWCGPCRREYPYFNLAYKQFGDKVAFVGLTVEPEDTMETVRAIKELNGMEYPVGQEAGTGIVEHIGGTHGNPTTIIVDRFGNAVFIQSFAFRNGPELFRLLKLFLGEEYTETKAATRIPTPDGTQALPVSSTRKMRVENEGARKVIFNGRDRDPEEYAKYGDWQEEGYVVPGKTAKIVIELTAEDDPSRITFVNDNTRFFDMFSLLDKERNAYVYEQDMVNGLSNYYFVSLHDGLSTEDRTLEELQLFPSEEVIQEFVDFMLEANDFIYTWEYADEEEPETVQGTYTLHVTDQYGEAVPGVMVSFCTDAACVAETADDNGVITFNGEAEDYHVQILKVPEGYSFDKEFELRTGSKNEFVVIIQRD